MSGEIQLGADFINLFQYIDIKYLGLNLMQVWSCEKSLVASQTHIPAGSDGGSLFANLNSSFHLGHLLKILVGTFPYFFTPPEPFI